MSQTKQTLKYHSSGLRPLGRAVLVEPYEPEFDSSVIAIPDTVRERTLMSEMRGVVLAVGPTCWRDEPEPRAVVGDKVLISKWSGVIVKGPLDGKMYRLCNEEDIFCGIDGELEGILIQREQKAQSAPQIVGARR